MKYSLVFLCLSLFSVISHGQDIPAPGPEEFTEPPPATTTTVPSSTTEPSREPEETTKGVTEASTDVGPPSFNKNLFKWVQYRKFSE